MPTEMQTGLFPAWTWIVGLLIGAAMGSFLNVVIYRLPRNISLSNPPKSFCPKCEHSLGVLDLFPLFSWLLSGGRCRYCRERVPARYFVVELLTGGIWGLLWFQTLVLAWDPARGVFFALVASALVAIIFIDAELFIIPDELNAALLILAFAFHAFAGDLRTALVGALVGWGLLWGIAFFGRLLFGKDAMGDGDIKMMRGVGALIGPVLVLANLGIAVVLGLVGGIVSMMALKARAAAASPTAEVPEVDYPPTPVPILLLLGGWYLLCLDVIALFVPPLNRWLERRLPPGMLEEEDDWQPTFTTIPFGPYLAAGALLCMLFPGAILGALERYWEGVTGPDPAPVGAAMENPERTSTRGSPLDIFAAPHDAAGVALANWRIFSEQPMARTCLRTSGEPGADCA
jgi:leader peptidase (prepilin peptidase) / N-methyltransferase